jgi:glycosyl transferase family 25
MHLQNFFERIYVINLPERADRRRAVIQELEDFGISPSSGKVEIFPAIRPTNAGAFPNIGILGCCLSHLEVLRQAQKRGLSNVLILEDDVCFSKRLKIEETQLIAQLTSMKWDMIHFGYFPYHGFDYSDYYGNAFSSNDPCSIIALNPGQPPLQGTHFYGVNSSIFSRLIEFLER